MNHIYNENNVGIKVKQFVEIFNKFLINYERFPNPKLYSEKRLYLKWQRFSNPDNLNQDEKIYIDKKLINVENSYIGKMITGVDENIKIEKGENVRTVVKKFVEEYNKFLLIHNRKPNSNNPEEASLYLKHRNYCSDKFSSEQEIEYINNNLLKFNVRTAIVNFVNDFNKFVIENKRVPSSASVGEECNLYTKWKFYLRLESLNEDEIKYIENNLVVHYIMPKKTKRDNVRLTLKNFVQDFNAFINKNGRLPKSTVKNKEERLIYSQWLYFSNPKNVNQEELEYIDKLLVKRDNVSIYVKRFVDDYNNFVKKYNRHPQQKRSSEESLIYRRWLLYTKTKTLNDEEVEYIKKNLNDMSNVRSFIVNFVEKYNAFIEEHHRKPSYYVKRDSEERNLSKKLYDITHLRMLTESEIEYLNLFNIEVQGDKRIIENKS